MGVIMRDGIRYGNSDSIELTKAEYDALVENNEIEPDVNYFVTDEEEVIEVDSVKLQNDQGTIRFGIDENGNWGYFKDGADTVTPFKSGEGSAVPTLVNFGAYYDQKMAMTYKYNKDKTINTYWNGSTGIGLNFGTFIDLTEVNSIKVTYDSERYYSTDWSVQLGISEPNNVYMDIPSNVASVIKYVKDNSTPGTDKTLEINTRDIKGIKFICLCSTGVQAHYKSIIFDGYPECGSNFSATVKLSQSEGVTRCKLSGMFNRDIYENDLVSENILVNIKNPDIYEVTVNDVSNPCGYIVVIEKDKVYEYTPNLIIRDGVKVKSMSLGTEESPTCYIMGNKADDQLITGGRYWKRTVDVSRFMLAIPVKNATSSASTGYVVLAEDASDYLDASKCSVTASGNIVTGANIILSDNRRLYVGWQAGWLMSDVSRFIISGKTYELYNERSPFLPNATYATEFLNNPLVQNLGLYLHQLNDIGELMDYNVFKLHSSLKTGFLVDGDYISTADYFKKMNEGSMSTSVSNEGLETRWGGGTGIGARIGGKYPIPKDVKRIRYTIETGTSYYNNVSKNERFKIYVGCISKVFSDYNPYYYIVSKTYTDGDATIQGEIDISDIDQDLYFDFNPAGWNATMTSLEYLTDRKRYVPITDGDIIPSSNNDYDIVYEQSGNRSINIEDYGIFAMVSISSNSVAQVYSKIKYNVDKYQKLKISCAIFSSSGDAQWNACFGLSNEQNNMSNRQYAINNSVRCGTFPYICYKQVFELDISDLTGEYYAYVYLGSQGMNITRMWLE